MGPPEDQRDACIQAYRKEKSLVASDVKKSFLLREATWTKKFGVEGEKSPYSHNMVLPRTGSVTDIYCGILYLQRKPL
ncbi:hypothetical protein J6590_084995 [Homalodisca vitripennis]|nr:hypothetical protein J6590_084995 [Homalodisca vitripennis]